MVQYVRNSKGVSATYVFVFPEMKSARLEPSWQQRRSCMSAFAKPRMY